MLSFEHDGNGDLGFFPTLAFVGGWGETVREVISENETLDFGNDDYESFGTDLARVCAAADFRLRDIPVCAGFSDDLWTGLFLWPHAAPAVSTEVHSEAFTTLLVPFLLLPVPSSLH